ncbi:MAG: aminotransferase class I/II-fold pyridoxal phosphate-dependent enzyme [Chitinophagaceae bacterium]
MDLSFILNELGEERANYFNAVSPPIAQTSNFAFKKVADMRKAFEDEMGGYLYSRGLNPTVDILRKKLAALDGAEDCLVFNSGAAAVFAAILANVKSGDHVVSIKKPYTWVQRMLDVMLPRFGITATYIDGTRIGHFEEAIRSNTTLIYVESPNSWDYALQDLQAVAALAKQRGIITVCDNSYCTPLYQQPIALGIDIAMQTATKYIGGHSDTLGGVISGSHAMMKRIFNSEYLTIGSGIQPFNAWLLIRGLRTLPARFERITRTTGRLVEYLKQHPLIEEVIFPFDAGFPQYELAKKQMKGACGLVTVVLKAERMEQVVTFCESLRHILMAVSWGGHESLAIPKCASMDPASFNPADREHRMIRFYFGLEEPDYLIEDIEQALGAISQ